MRQSFGYFKFLLFSFFVCTSFAHAAYPDGTELIRYNFEEGSGTIINRGTGGATYDSALTGNAAFQATTSSPFGNYVGLFDTSGDYIDTKFGNAVNPTTNAISVSLWVKQMTACSGTDRHVFGYGASGVNTRFYIRCLASDGKWNYRLGGSAAVSVGSAVSLDRWYHLALVTEGTNVRFYVNGVNMGTTTIASYAIGGNLYVGTINATPTQGSGAAIDEVAIYSNKSLSDAEVAAIYTAGADVLVNATSTTATEGGSTGSYAVSLKTAPTANVTVNISSDSQATTSASSLTFTTSNWFTPQTVTVTATDDAVVEGSHTATISHTTTSSDTNYNGLTGDSVTVTITDNDVDAMPTISSVNSTASNGYYGAGAVIPINITFSEAVTATSSVTVTLETGVTDRTCTFTVSNSSTASCNYTVEAGDTTSDLTVSSISGYIEDQTAHPMVNFVPSTNLATNKNIAIGEYISFVSPTISPNSTTSASSVTVYASSTMLTGTTTTWYLSLETPGGSAVSSVSTTTRYGDYNIAHLTNVLSSSDLSLAGNSSGIAYVPTTGTLFVVHNAATGSDATIDEVNQSGTLVRSITCTTCGDIESITLLSSTASTTVGGFDHTFMIGTENNTSSAEIFRVIIHSTGSVTVNKNDYYNTGITHGSNGGLEGIAYNPDTGVFYVARELSTPALYQVTLGSGHSASATAICTNLTWNAGVTDFSDLAYKNGVLYVLSENTNPSKLVPVNITNTSSCTYVDSDGDGDTSSSDTGDWLTSLPVGVTDQAEGVSWDDTGDYLYVLGEADFLAKYRTNAYTVRYTFTGLSSGSYVLKASSTDASTGLTAYSPHLAFGVNLDSTPPSLSNIASTTDSTTATVSWDTNEASDSKVAYGTSSGVYTTSSSSATLTTSHSVGLTGLSENTQYYYVVVSADNSGNTSTSSEKTLLTVDHSGPVLSNIASSTTSTTATVEWDTNESSDSKLYYGTSTGVYGASTSSASMVTSHSLGVSGLTEDTLYYFVVVSVDGSGNTSTSSENTLRTSDGSAPIISSVASTTNATTATVTWTTNENSDSKVSYGTSTGVYGSSSSSAALLTSHSIGLTGLSENTLYYFVVVSKDSTNNYSTSSEYTLRTTDITAPIISSVASSTTSSSATISWTTNEAATSTVEYGSTLSYGSTSNDSSYVTSHSVTLTGLLENSTYHFRVSSGDASYNNATSSDYTFRTLPDTGAPALSSVTASASDTSATVTWTTDENASSYVGFGVSETYSATTTESDTVSKVTSHSVIIPDLLACTKYYYRASSRDTAGNAGFSTGLSFTTSGCTGSASIESVEVEDLDVTSGGTVILAGSGQSAELTIPAFVTSSSSALTFQLKIITDSNVIDSVSAPASKTVVEGQIYDFKAYSDATTTVSSFEAPITVTLSYSDSDINGIDESSLKIYRYSGSEWEELSSCTVDTSANTVTCTTTHFSVFGLFGTTRRLSGGGAGFRITYGCTDPKALNYSKNVRSKPELCQYSTIAVVTPPTIAPANTSPLASTTPTLTVSVRDLMIGMNGQDVMLLQKLLNANGYIVASSGPGAPGHETTLFGALTKQALARYQKVNGITPVYGYLGPVTRDHMKAKGLSGIWWK